MFLYLNINHKNKPRAKKLARFYLISKYCGIRLYFVNVYFQPVLLKRIKLDPAVCSAPFVATLVDVTKAYYATIKIKTGKTPADFKKLAEEKDFMVKGKLKPTIKATQVFDWLKEDFKLGRGHGLAIYHALKEGIY